MNPITYHSQCYLVFIQDHIKLWSPGVAKSASSLLKYCIFDDANQYFKNPKVDNAELLEIPSDYDCLLFVRDPISRAPSGLAEAYIRYLKESKYDGLWDWDWNHSNTSIDQDIETEFKEFINTHTFKEIVAFHSRSSGVEEHIERQSFLNGWNMLSMYQDNITMIEVDDNVFRNAAHWMRERGTPVKDDVNIIRNSTLTGNGRKAYFKGAYEALMAVNHNNFMDELLEFYQPDIDFYNSVKSSFYRGAEQ